jgi:UDP-N-acetylmuramate--alanine ligase
MHIYFSGIGGAGIGPLALIAHQTGYEVSGSDKQDSSYIEYLRKKGLANIHVGQTEEAIKAIHDKHPIDWFVYSSSLVMENLNAPELVFAKSEDIKVSKRDELLNEILKDKGLKLIAIAGTHGKTTTTAMTTWLFKDQGVPISYLLPAKTSYAEMGEYNPDSEYFVYEADEFDRNFLSFEPEVSLISGVSWDHHEIFPTREDYQAAFREFISQSKSTFVWDEDADYLDLNSDRSLNISVLDSSLSEINELQIIGKYNRFDAWLALSSVSRLIGVSKDKLVESINHFPGLSRRMEQIAPSLYSDYAHTPEKIKGSIDAALEIAGAKGQELIIVYEPLTDRRQHYIKEQYKEVFEGTNHLYWLPSYLAREDKNTPILTPNELITYLADPKLAEPANKDDALKQVIADHLKQGAMVVGIAGGGGGSLDEWLRKAFVS